MAGALVVLQSFPTCLSNNGASYCGGRSGASSSCSLSSSVCFPVSNNSASSSGRRLASSSSSSSSPSSRCQNSRVQQRSESISLCTDADCVDVAELGALLAATRQNCEQFPTVLDDGSVAPVDPVKLRRALRNSAVVVALYVETPETGAESGGRGAAEKLGHRRGWLDSWMPQVPMHKTLIAFGRATSDYTLTASIYDLVVAPSYQGSGYGSRVLLRIVRELSRRGISDIAATPSPELRPFFQHCGFGSDTLKSVTMMYTRGASSTTESWQIRDYGRKSLLIPPPLGVLQRKGSCRLC